MTAQGLRRLGGGEVTSGGGKVPGVLVPFAVVAGTGNPIGPIVGGAVKLRGEEFGSATIEGAAKRTAEAIMQQMRPTIGRQGWLGAVSGPDRRPRLRRPRSCGPRSGQLRRRHPGLAISTGTGAMFTRRTAAAGLILAAPPGCAAQRAETAAPAVWCPRAGARILLGLLVDAFLPAGPAACSPSTARSSAVGVERIQVGNPPRSRALVGCPLRQGERGRRHKTLLDWGRQLALQARRWPPGRDLVPVTDGGFAAPPFLDAVRRGGTTAVTRPRLDATLREPAPPRPPGTVGRGGRPRTKGARPPSLPEALAAQDSPWQALRVPGRHGADERAGEIASAAAARRHGGLPVVPIRWALIRDPGSRLAPQALPYTDPARDTAQIVARVVRRWRAE